MAEWINDSEHYCKNCNITFKVYAKDEEPWVNFCPNCGSRNLDDVEE